MKLKGYRDLIVYKKAFALAMDLYRTSKHFPIEEKYDLTSQIRRSSRAVCSAIAEAYRKRQYPKHFVSKASDADSENSETVVWLEFALACEYISREQFDLLESGAEEVGKILHSMMKNPEKFLPKSMMSSEG